MYKAEITDMASHLITIPHKAPDGTTFNKRYGIVVIDPAAPNIVVNGTHTWTVDGK